MMTTSLMKDAEMSKEKAMWAVVCGEGEAQRHRARFLVHPQLNRAASRSGLVSEQDPLRRYKCAPFICLQAAFALMKTASRSTCNQSVSLTHEALFDEIRPPVPTNLLNARKAKAEARKLNSDFPFSNKRSS